MPIVMKREQAKEAIDLLVRETTGRSRSCATMVRYSSPVRCV